jgi:hypothetical protein
MTIKTTDFQNGLQTAIDICDKTEMEFLRKAEKADTPQKAQHYTDFAAGVSSCREDIYARLRDAAKVAALVGKKCWPLIP